MNHYLPNVGHFVTLDFCDLRFLTRVYWEVIFVWSRGVVGITLVHPDLILSVHGPRLCETPTFQVFITLSVTQIPDLSEWCAMKDKAVLQPEKPGFKFDT